MQGVEIGLADGVEFAVRFYVFRDEEYLGWDCFVDEQITIGSGENADLLLDDPAVSSVHAHCRLNDEGITIIANDNCSLFVNSCPSARSEIGPLDSIDIGPFTLKIKAARKSSVTSSSHPVSENDPCETFEEPEIPVPSYLDISNLPKTETETETETDQDAGIQVAPSDVLEKEGKETSEDIKDLRTFFPADEDDDEGEDDYEEETPLSLHQKLLVDGRTQETGRRVGSKSVEVFKIRSNRVVDTAFLSGRERYLTSGDKGMFLLSENRGAGKCYFYFTEAFTGVIRGDDGSKDLKELFSPGNIFRKGQGIYRYKIPENGDVSLKYGHFEFLLRCADERKMVSVPPTPREESFIFRNLAKSSIVHIISLVVVWQITLHQIEPPRKKLKDVSIFVQVDPSLIKALIKPKIKKVTPPVRKVVKKVLPKPKLKPKPKPKVIAKVPKKKAEKAKPPEKKVTPKVAKASKKPEVTSQKKAKPKVKELSRGQEAMLSTLALFEDIALLPDDALAEVTNLDAVSSLDDSTADFKIGGIVEKLDTPDIRVARPGVISTRGSSQILEAGYNGERLAALTSPSAGQGDVRALVSAKLNRSVKVRGGMSREEVKRVIDQHLDEISYCYESVLLSKPSLSGKMVAEWTILKSGRVGDVKVDFSTVNSAEMHSCIRGAIKTWIFPKPKGAEVVVSYPFIFDVLGF